MRKYHDQFSSTILGGPHPEPSHFESHPGVGDLKFAIVGGFKLFSLPSGRANRTVLR